MIDEPTRAPFRAYASSLLWVCAVATAGLLAAAGCSRHEDAPHEPPPPAAMGTTARPGILPGTLRFAVAAMLGPQSTYEAYVEWFGATADELGRPYRFIQRRTYQEINQLLVDGELDLAFICSGAYVALPRDAVELIAVPVVGGEKVYHSYVVVADDNAAETFEDLRGTRFAFTDPLSNTGFIYPASRIVGFGTTPEEFFSAITYSGSHDRSLMAVHRKLVDAAAVDSLVFEKLVVAGSSYWRHLRIIERSPPFAMPPVVSPSSVPAGLRAQMRKLLLAMSTTPSGKGLLAKLGFDAFALETDAEYDAIRKMRRVVVGNAR